METNFRGDLVCRFIDAVFVKEDLKKKKCECAEKLTTKLILATNFSIHHMLYLWIHIFIPQNIILKSDYILEALGEIQKHTSTWAQAHRNSDLSGLQRSAHGSVFKNFIQLLYNTVLISVVQQSGPIIHIRTSSLF